MRPPDDFEDLVSYAIDDLDRVPLVPASPAPPPAREPDTEATPSPPEEVGALRARARRAAVDWLERRTHVSRAGQSAPSPVRGEDGPGVFGGGLLRMRLDELRFAIIDLETTGAGPVHGDAILELGVVWATGWEATERELSLLVDPERPISRRAMALHGIRQADVAGAPTIRHVLPHLADALQGRVLVFHNAPFDLGFLQQAWADAGRGALDAPVVDTLRWARRLLGGACGLGRVARRLGWDDPHVHRALPDARLTTRLLRVLLRTWWDAGARVLAELPDVHRAGDARRRPARTPSELRRRLQQARARGEALRLSVRVGPGVEPVDVEGHVDALRGVEVVLVDLDQGVPRVVPLERIDRITPVHPGEDLQHR